MKKLNIAKVCIIGSIICFAWALIETIVEGIDYLLNPGRTFGFLAFIYNWYPLVPAVVLLVAGIIIKIVKKKSNKQ